MSYSSAVLALSPLAYYKLDETSGTTLTDSSGNGRDGTWNGSPTRGATGAFTGSNAYTTGGGGATVADASWNSITGAFSIVVWHKPNGTDGYFVEKYTTPAVQGYLFRLTSGKPQAYTLSGSATSMTTTATPATGRWHQYVFTFDGTNGRIYLNGALAAGPTAMNTPTDGTSTLKIGQRGDDGTNASCGDLDEVSIHTGALTAAEVKTLYLAAKAMEGTYASTVASDAPDLWWKLDEASGTVAVDSAGNVRDGTYTSVVSQAQTSLLTEGVGKSVQISTTGDGSVDKSVIRAYESWMNVTSGNGFTVETLCRLDALPAGAALRTIFARNEALGASSEHYALYVQSDGSLLFLTHNDSGTSLTNTSAASTFAASKDYHVALRWDFTTDTIKVFLTNITDGGSTSAVITVTSATGVDPAGTQPMKVGNIGPTNSAVGWQWRGRFQHYAFYLSPLSDARITAHADAAKSTGASAVSVSVPVMAVSEAAPVPTVSAGTAVTVAAPVLALSLALLAPTVSAGTGVAVAPPVMAVTTSAPAPDVVITPMTTVAVPVADLTVAMPTPTVTAGATVAVDVPVAALTVAVPAPVASVGSPAAVTVPSMALTFAAPAPDVSTTTLDYITVTIDAGVTLDPLSVEIGGATGVEDVVTVDLDAAVDLTPYVLLRPVAPTVGVINEWPIERQAHLMAALSAASPSYRGGIDYTIDRDVTGRLHVFVGGQDVTYKDGCPAFFEDWSSSVPFGPETARIAMPQMKPWDDPGSGDWAMFVEDAPVEIALVRPDDTVDHLWEGFLAVEGDTSGQSSEDYTLTADGLFAQAAHELHDPPIVMAARDYGHIIADVLNSVTHRRWSKIPRFTSGYTTLYRGEQGQTKWQYVQDLLARCFHADHRQLTIARVAPYTYRVQWKKAADAAADWTVTKGAPGVAVSLERNHSSRVDAIYGRGFAPDGGFWCGRVFPGLDAGVPPLYPMAGFANISVGTTDADTTTGNGVTTWQRQMREMGYPVTVDGVMNSADTYWVEKIQRASGSTVDGSLGPQTWAATWENNSTAGDFTSYRLPLATRTEVEPNLYAANGAIIGANPGDDPSVVRHAIEVDFKTNITKSAATVLARQMLERLQVVGYQGTITLLTDPHEDGSSRFDIKPGDNIEVIGHHGGVTVQVSEVSASGLEVRLTVDSLARDAEIVASMLDRAEEARRDLAGRTGGRDASKLNNARTVPYESESKAGRIARTAVNGNSGLWTIRKAFVSQVGVAKIEFTTSPDAEFVVALLNRPTTANRIASLVPDPLASSDGWYDAVETLKESYGLMEVFGTPENSGGYWPRQEGDGPLTGELRDSASLLYDSPYGGFVWVAMFTSKSCWVEGTVFPAVPT